MPITHIQCTTIQVSDQDAAIDFFVNKLGFEKRDDEPFGENPRERWVTVAPTGAQTLLVLAKGYGGDPDNLGKFTGIVFEPDDIDSTYRDMQEKGVEFTEPLAMQPWGMKQALFKDGDGNIFVLVGK